MLDTVRRVGRRDVLQSRAVADIMNGRKPDLDMEGLRLSDL
jgi:hypothetical protein